MSAARSGLWGVIASLAVHAMVMLWLPRAHGVSVADAALPPNTPRTARAPMLPPARTAMLIEMTVIEPTGSPHAVAAPDTGGDRAGGERNAPSTTWLLDQVATLTLQDSMRNTQRDSQVQRIDTAAQRSSWENRRATPHPNDDPFLATGDGWLRQRTVSAQRAPQAGQRAPTALARATGAGMHRAEERALPPAQPTLPGAPDPTVIARQLGLRDAHGRLAQRAAPMRSGRPDLDPGPAATPARDVDQVRDNRASELRAAELMQAFVQAGAASTEQGDQAGGERGAGQVGVGRGHSPGATSSAHGRGGTADPGGERYIRWYTQQRERIGRALVFPRARQLTMDQGTTLLRFSVGRDGLLLEPPRVVRSSGFGDLDAAALAAVHRSAPFPPLPPEIAPDRSQIRLTVPVEFWNPTVH